MVEGICPTKNNCWIYLKPGCKFKFVYCEGVYIKIIVNLELQGTLGDPFYQGPTQIRLLPNTALSYPNHSSCISCAQRCKVCGQLGRHCPVGSGTSSRILRGSPKLTHFLDICGSICMIFNIFGSILVILGSILDIF